MPLRFTGKGADNRDILVARFEIENEDVFHLKNLYKLMYAWMIEEGFRDDNLPGGKYAEDLYWEKTNTNGMKEQHIWWRFSKLPNNSPYFKYFVKIDFQTILLTKKEIVHQGQKFGTNKSDTILRVEAWLQLDYKDEFKKSTFLKFFANTFRSRFYKEQVDKYKGNLFNDIYRFQSTIKNYLNLKNPHEPPKLFVPKKGVDTEEIR